MGCMMGVCNKCMGAMKVVVGLLILANVYFMRLDWAVFIGGLLVVGGLAKLVMPSCGHCCDDKVAGKKKK